MNYLVILEANDDPCGVVDRFDREVIDKAFDQSRLQLFGDGADI